MNEKNGSGESKPKQSQRQGESAPELSVGRAYAVEPLAVGKVWSTTRLSLNVLNGFDAVAIFKTKIWISVLGRLKNKEVSG